MSKSKWNVQTKNGQLVSAKGGFDDFLDESGTTAVNHTNTGVNYSQHESNQLHGTLFLSKEERNALFHSRKFRCGCCCFGFLIVLAILIGVLFPRIPTVEINRRETAKTLGVQRAQNGSIVGITGNMSIVFNNPNVYGISLAGMDIQGLIGRQAPNQIPFANTIGALEIPASAASLFILPIAVPIPYGIDIVALGADIILDCLDNLMTSTVSGQAKINVLGTVVPFSFGPMVVESPCLE